MDLFGFGTLMSHLLRLIIGSAELLAGLGLVAGLWGTALNRKMPLGVEQVNALLLCDALGLCVVQGTAVFVHCSLGEGVGGAGPPLVVTTLLGVCRVLTTPPTCLLGPSLGFIKQFSYLCGGLVVCSLLSRVVCGSSKADVEPAQEEMKAMMMAGSEYIE